MQKIQLVHQLCCMKPFCHLKKLEGRFFLFFFLYLCASTSCIWRVKLNFYGQLGIDEIFSISCSLRHLIGVCNYCRNF